MGANSRFRRGVAASERKAKRLWAPTAGESEGDWNGARIRRGTMTGGQREASASISTRAVNAQVAESVCVDAPAVQDYYW